ncbi:trehalose-specific PTS system EIIBC component [Escherichia coli]|uniref:Trehalose-specific PTS system EIIBC component n=1 Tax=Escherichia coli TaxID=562 RepID=A0A377A555_ECOLX|nr:trehalose-specific PTS system EIIBC component [Escherichia coli]
MKWHEQLISHFAEIFFPLLPALISGGLILGFRNVIGDLPMSNGQTLGANVPFPANDLRFSVVDR